MKQITEDIMIVPVNEEYVFEASSIVKSGLSEYFDTYDSNFNPDLENILKFYDNDDKLFIVAIYNGQVIGTGALIEECNDVVRIARMSVKKEFRGINIGSKILSTLEEIAMNRKYKKIVLETTKTWEKTKQFYKMNNYIIENEDDENSNFIKRI